jgi:phosphoglycerate dehydrogenase-like enzyme
MTEQRAHRLAHLDPLSRTDESRVEYRRALEDYFATHTPGGVRIQFEAPATEDFSEMSGMASRADYWVVTNAAASKTLIDAAPRLKYIHRIGTARDAVDVAAATARGVVVSTSSHAGSAAVAEHTLLLMLALGKDLVRLHHRAASGENPRGLAPQRATERLRQYNYLGLPGDHFTQLHGRTLGIVGLGEIGTEVARRAAAFGMRVLYQKRRRLERAEEEALGVRFADLEPLLGASDFVSLHVPRAPDTEQMIGGRELRAMRPRAYLINTARGGIVDEEALARALRERWIAGAGLDVLAVEPPDPSNPLLGLPNVILSPHVAARGPVIDRYEMFLRSLETFIQGGRPERVLNPSVLR